MVNLNIIDWAKRTDPSGKVAAVAMLLAMTNQIVANITSKEGNLPTGERTTIQTGLPTVYYRALNQGIAPSKGTTVQVDEQCAIAEARSEVDLTLINLNGNSAAFRLSEAQMFIEAMNQTISTGIFYGNPAVDPKQFLGLTQRYSDLTAGNAQNILSAGGTTALSQTSIWLLYTSDQTIYTVFPKGSKAGLVHEDLGRQTSYDAGGTGLRLEVMADWFQWQIGLVVKDWRAAVRICNIEATAATLGSLAGTGGADPASKTNIIHQMVKALARVPKGVKASARGGFYMNASVFSALMRIALEKSVAALSLQEAAGQFGMPGMQMSFMGVPIYQCDAIVNTEAVVS